MKVRPGMVAVARLGSVQEKTVARGVVPSAQPMKEDSASNRVFLDPLVMNQEEEESAFLAYSIGAARTLPTRSMNCHPADH